MFRALRIPDFRLLWSGGLISSLGSWLLVLAVPAHILAVTGSLRDTGLTLAAEYLPQLVLGPVAGVVADRWDRRRLMIATNLFCAGAVAVMLLGTSTGRYWVLYVALIAESGGAVLYAPALQARVPAVVVSPYAKQGWVSPGDPDTAFFDHTSILRLVEEKWNLPALTRRDLDARNPERGSILDALDRVGEAVGHQLRRGFEAPPLADVANRRRDRDAVFGSERAETHFDGELGPVLAATKELQPGAHRARARVPEEETLRELGILGQAPDYLRQRLDRVESPDYLVLDRPWPWTHCGTRSGRT